MPVFRDEEQTYEVFGGLWREVLSEGKLSEKLRKMKLTMKFITRNPDGCMWICYDTVLTGPEADRDAVITMELPADMAHEFWLDNLELGKALISNEVKVRGPLPKLMGLMPMLKFVYKKYPDHCEKHGLPTE